MADVRKLELLVSAKDDTARGLDSVNRRLRGTSDAAGLIKQAFAAIGFAVAINQIRSYADAWTQATNRLNVALGDSKAAADVQQKILDISNRTRSDFETQIQLYQRLSLAGKALGADQGTLLKFTEGVGKALAASGTGSAQASGALLQLSQALGSGIVRAEEFNSVIEGAPRIAQAVADGIPRLKGSVAELRKEILAGGMTSREFFEAFLSQIPKLGEEFDRTSPTISQAFTVLSNNMTAFIGQTDQAIGASAALSEAIVAVANNLKPMAEGLLVFGATLAVAFAPATLSFLLGLVEGFFALEAVAAVVTTLLAPLAAIPIALAAAAGALYAFRDRIFPVTDSLATLAEYAEAAFNLIAPWVASAASAIADLLAPALRGIGEGLAETGRLLALIPKGVVALADLIIDVVVAAVRGIVALIGEAWTSFVRLTSAMSDVAYAFGKDLNRLLFDREWDFSGFKGALERVGKDFAEGMDKSTARVVEVVQDSLTKNFIGGLKDAAIEAVSEIGAAWTVEANKIAAQKLGLFTDFSAPGPTPVYPAGFVMQTTPKSGGKPPPPSPKPDKGAEAAAKRYADGLDRLGASSAKAAFELAKLNASTEQAARLSVTEQMISAIDAIEKIEAEAVRSAKGNVSKIADAHRAAGEAITAETTKYHAEIAKIEKDSAENRAAIARKLDLDLVPRLGRSAAEEEASIKGRLEELQKLIETNPELEAKVKLVAAQTVTDWRAKVQEDLDTQALRLRVEAHPGDRQAQTDLELKQLADKIAAERATLQQRQSQGFDVSGPLADLDAGWARQRDQIELANSSLGDFLGTLKSLGSETLTNFTGAIGDAFIGFIEGADNAADAFADFAKSTAEQVTKLIVQMLVLWAVQKAIGFAIGDPNFSFSGLIAPPATASGGIVLGPQVRMVGEGGEPEAIVPLSKAKEMGFGGGGPVNVTTVVNVNSGSVSSQTQAQGGGPSMAQLGRAISARVTEEIMRQKRAGGLLSATAA